LSEILLTDRWFTIPEHVQKLEVQNELRDSFLNREALNFCVAAGRRSFKTERFIKRQAVYIAIHWKGSYLLGAPTRQQAKDIFWEDLKALSHPIFVARISETELKITYKNGNSLQLIGLKEFRRKQGSLTHGVFVTEYQDCDPAVYTHTFQPMLNDTGGFWFTEGRPLGKNHHFDNFIKGKEKKDGWRSFHWTSEVVLSAEQIQRAKAEITDLDYRREYLADFDTLSGKPYYCYSERNHAVEPYDVRKYPLIVACDFNATEKPMSWNVGFEKIIGVESVTFWIKTFSLQFTNTYAMCEVLDRWIIQKYGSFPFEMHFYGDYAGTQKRSNSQLTDWQIIEDYFRNKSNIKTFIKPCLSIRDSIGATNARLKNALNQYRMFIDPVECDALKQDWIRIGWKENGVELEDDDDLRGHACFIGKTLIATLTGMRQIKDIKAGDYVYTSSGIRKVLNSTMTNPSADVYEYIFSNGKKVICTKDHPFFINNNYKPIGLLSSSDIITILDETKMSIRWKRTSLFIKALDMLDSLTLKIERQDVIIRLHQKEKTQRDFINKFILIVMEKFQKVIISIIKTAIRSITTYLIWKQLVVLNTQQIIQNNYGKTIKKKCLNVVVRILMLPKRNICNGLKRIKKICRNVVKNNGEKENRKNIFVKFAGSNMRRKITTQTKNIVQEIAIQNNVEIKSSILRQEIVSIAETNFKRINILNKNLVQDDAVTLLSGKLRGKEPVYNLNVEGEHNYFANGILVSNCRALDYFCDYKYPNYNLGGTKII